MFRNFIIFFIFILPTTVHGQYNWELERDENGIQVFSSKLSFTKFKAIKVESIFDGDLDMLMELLTTTDGMKGWVYRTENIKLLSSIADKEITFYSETHLPWPLANRDAVIKLQIDKDNLPDYIHIKGTCDPNGVPKIKGLVRLSHFVANWRIKILNDQKMHIQYIVEVDPGGDIPAWINNMFIVTGPYKTFMNLAEILNSKSTN